MNTYVVTSGAGPLRDRTRPTREQPDWDEHAEFIDALVADGFIFLGGPFPDQHGAMVVVNAESEAEVQARLESDPWYRNGVLKLEAIKRWQIFIDERGG